MKTHVITILDKFPKTHPKAGEYTGFDVFFLLCPKQKSHTIRNYDDWVAKIEEVQRGEAVLSVRTWSGVPYRSSQITLADLTQENNIGIERAYLLSDSAIVEQKHVVSRDLLAQNDGLCREDFDAWFDGQNSNNLGIIHFTGFRYADGAN